ncbi:hypothetical protein CRYUN_Cryun38cG0041300 [Craigia yunnanensis]
MGYNDSTNVVKDVVTFSSQEAEAVQVHPGRPTVVDDGYISGKKHKKNRKRRSCFLLCCSNIELENIEEEKKKAFSSMENSNRSCMMLCFSNFEVGQKTKGDYMTTKVNSK